MTNRIAALLALIAAGALTVSLSACGDTNAASGNADGQTTSSQDTTTADASSDDAADDGAASFEEIPIGNDQEVFPLNVAAVYFQPVDMYPEGTGLKAVDANLHLEADIHALKDNKLGYATGEFVPKLTVKYRIEDKNDASNVQEGTFMEMNADDGPHYGANIKLDKAGEYTLTFIIYSPETNGWTLHVDPDTGVEGRFWTEPLEASFDWDYTVHQW